MSLDGTLSDPVGPALDSQARREIIREDDRHRQRLLEIERESSELWSDLLAAENDTHLRRLTQIYSQLADRGVDSAMDQQHQSE